MRTARARVATVASTLSMALAAAMTGACGDVTGLVPTTETLFDTLSVFPLTGSTAETPTALNMLFGEVTPIGASGNFDVAFDLDDQRRVVIYPVKLIVQPLSGVTQVGLLKVSGTFESIDRAPSVEFETDSALTVSVGEVAVIASRRTQAGDICAFAISPNIYSKLVVDSVSAGNNEIWFRAVTNPNCGLRSFAPGVPRN